MSLARQQSAFLILQALMKSLPLPDPVREAVICHRVLQRRLKVVYSSFVILRDLPVAGLSQLSHQPLEAVPLVIELLPLLLTLQHLCLVFSRLCRQRGLGCLQLALLRLCLALTFRSSQFCLQFFDPEIGLAGRFYPLRGVLRRTLDSLAVV